MSKRKNPLQNLDDFLKQEATSLVTPKKLSVPKAVPQEVAPTTEIPAKPATARPSAPVSIELVSEMLQKLANKNNISVKQQLAELTKYILEENGLESSKEKMLLNTILYIQHGDTWREKVAEYWEKTRPKQG